MRWPSLRGALLALAVAASPRGRAQAWEAGTDGLLPIPPLTRARHRSHADAVGAAEAAALEAKLADWEARTVNQLVVLMVPTTQPEPIEAYSLRVAEKWKIGRKGQDNGALFLIAKNDRKMRIEVGYGLEGVLTDVTSRRIIAEDVAPPFREGQFAAGINAGVDRIIAVVGGGQAAAAASSRRAQRRAGGGFDFDTMLFILFIVVPVVGGVLRSIFGRLVGSTVGAGVVGAVAWFVAGSIAVRASSPQSSVFIVMIFAGAAWAAAGASRRRLDSPGGCGGGGAAASAAVAAAVASPAAAAASAAAARRAAGERIDHDAAACCAASSAIS